MGARLGPGVGVSISGYMSDMHSSLLLDFINDGRGTYQPHSTKHIDIEASLPVLDGCVAHLLYWIQRAVIDDERIEAAPALKGKIHGFRGKTWVCEIAGEHSDMVRAVLVVQLVQRSMRP